jgi:transcriptional regulator with GAF, ATPase, and Fis domain
MARTSGNDPAAAGASDDAELATQLQAFARRFVEGSGPLKPEQIVAQAAEALPRAAAAGLTLISGEKPPKTLAATDPLVQRVDTIQYDSGEGPCLEAIEDNDLIVADDLERDDRWPKFCARAVAETSVRSMVGVRIHLGGDDRGALNLYATEPGAFSRLDCGVVAIFSTLSSLALQHALEQRKSQNLTIALESSRQIGMAMGILMASKLIPADEAFEQLRAASQHLHRRVRDIAVEVAETGELPHLPPRHG